MLAPRQPVKSTSRQSEWVHNQFFALIVLRREPSTSSGTTRAEKPITIHNSDFWLKIFCNLSNQFYLTSKKAETRGQFSLLAGLASLGCQPNWCALYWSAVLWGVFLHPIRSKSNHPRPLSAALCSLVRPSSITAAVSGHKFRKEFSTSAVASESDLTSERKEVATHAYVLTHSPGSGWIAASILSNQQSN